MAAALRRPGLASSGTASAATPSSMAFAKHVGFPVLVKLVDGTEFESVLFGCDEGLRMYALRKEAAHTFSKADYTLLPESAIASCEVTDSKPARQFTVTVPSDVELARRSDSAAHAEAASAATKGGSGVSARAQSIIDHLARFYKCRWQGTSIVVEEKFVIPPPYSPSVAITNLLGGKTGSLEESSLEHLRQMLHKANTKAGSP